MHPDVAAWLLVYGIAQLAAHFVAYVWWFRHSRFAASERAIFLYHFSSACAIAAASAATVLAFRSSDVFAAACAAVFAHGIYSLTFLELWTLAQISYSREVLLRARDGQLDGKAIAELAAVGEAKRTLRLAALSRGGLVRHESGQWTLTRPGRIGALFLKIVLWLPAVRSAG